MLGLPTARCSSPASGHLLLNPWAWWQYAHNMSGAVDYRGVCDGGRRRVLPAQRETCEQGRIFVRLGVIVGLFVSVLQLFPLATRQGRMLARNQPATLAAMEALFEHSREPRWSSSASRMWQRRRSTIRWSCPKLLSFLT